MEEKNFSNIMLFNNSNYMQKNYSFNENENENTISKKYLKMKLKETANDSLKNEEEKYKINKNSHKNKIFQKNYGQKISSFYQLNSSTTNESKSENNLLENQSNDLLIDEYINELKEKFNDDLIFSEIMNKNINNYDHIFSSCPFCHHLAFAYKDVVSCFNKCFMMNVKICEINDKYTFDNLLNSYYEYCLYHLKCNGDIIPLFIDDKTKKPFYICTNCDKDIFEKNGIIL